MTLSIDDLSHPLELCSFCPKLCRFACPVAEVEHRETATPWGLMTYADDLRRQGKAPGPEAAQVWSHCTGCDRCQAVCKHDNPVADTVQILRAMIEAPHPVRLWAREIPPRPENWRALPLQGDTRLMVGRADGRRVEAALNIWALAELGPLGRTSVATAGHRLHAVGLLEEYADHQKALTTGLAGVTKVVCLDAEDVIALRRDLGAGISVVHLIEVINDVVPTNRVFAGDVLYLDACRCGRGLGLYDAPREALSAMTSGRLIEGLMSREEGGCCGAGAGYAALEPAHADEMARSWADVALDIPVVIVGHCADHMRAALAPRPVWSWIEAFAAGLKKEESA